MFTELTVPQHGPKYSVMRTQGCKTNVVTRIDNRMDASLTDIRALGVVYILLSSVD